MAVDGGATRGYSEPSISVSGLAPGTAHTARGYVVDKDGGVGPLTGVSFTVLSDQVFAERGDGRVLVSWTDAGGGNGGSRVVGGHESYQFPTEVGFVYVQPLDADARYDLATNFGFERVSSDLPGLELTLRTDATDLPSIYGVGDPRPTPLVGPGGIGQVSVGPMSSVGGAFVRLSARGDLGGLRAATAVPVLAVNAGSIDVLNAGVVTVAGRLGSLSSPAGIDRLSVGSYGVIDTGNAADAPADRDLVVTVGPDVGDRLNSGAQLGRRMLYRLDAQGRVASFQYGATGEGRYGGYAYDAADGLVTRAWDRYGVITYGRSNGGAVVASTTRTGAPSGAVGDYREAAPAVRGDGGGWLSEVYAGAASAYTSVASGGAYLVGQAREVAVVVGGVAQAVRADAFEVWSKGAETVSWVAQGAAQTLYAAGAKIEGIAEAQAEAFMKTVEAFGGDLRQVFAKVGQLNDAAADVLRAIVTNPEQFITNVVNGITGGLNQFVSTLDVTLPDALLKWLTKGVSLDKFPTNPTVENVAPWLLKFFKLDWDGVQSLLIEVVGAGNVAVLAQGYELLSAAWEKVKDAKEVTEFVNAVLKAADDKLPDGELFDTKNLVKFAVNELAKMVAREMAKQVPVLIAKYLTPAGGALATAYNTVKWLVDDFKSLTEVADKVVVVVQKLRDLALAPPTAPGAPAPAAVAALSAAVRDALTAGIPVVIGFVAKQTNLDTLPTAVVGTLRKLQDLPRTKIKAALGKLVGKVKDKLRLAGPHATEYQGLIGPVVTFKVGDETHRLWVVNQNGKPAVMLASMATPAESAKAFITRLFAGPIFSALSDEQKADLEVKFSEIAAAAQKTLNETLKIGNDPNAIRTVLSFSKALLSVESFFVETAVKLAESITPNGGSVVQASLEVRRQAIDYATRMQVAQNANLTTRNAKAAVARYVGPGVSRGAEGEGYSFGPEGGYDAWLVGTHPLVRKAIAGFTNRESNKKLIPGECAELKAIGALALKLDPHKRWTQAQFEDFLIHCEVATVDIKTAKNCTIMPELYWSTWPPR